MSSHNDDHNHSAEPKKVQFRTPLIMGFVTVLLIFLAVFPEKYESSTYINCLLFMT